MILLGIEITMPPNSSTLLPIRGKPDWVTYNNIFSAEIIDIFVAYYFPIPTSKLLIILHREVCEVSHSQHYGRLFVN